MIKCIRAGGFRYRSFRSISRRPSRPSTSRVLTCTALPRIKIPIRSTQEKPFFASPIINRSFLLKHRTRADESYLFASSRTVATKIIIPFDVNDLRAGGRSLFVDQRGYTDALRAAGNYQERHAANATCGCCELLNAVPIA